MFFVRIDDRYIHGQVGAVWASHLQIKNILIANDELVKDSLACTMQKLSASSLKVIIKNVDDASKYLSSLPEHILKKTLLIVNCPLDVLRIINNGFDIKHVNIGHSKPDKNKKQVVKYLNVGVEDLVAYQELQKKGVLIEFQLVPNNKPIVIDYVNLSLD